MSSIQQQSSSGLPGLTLVKAGAGAGKTHRIQQNLTHWIRAGNVRPDKILAVTFTNSAANEMKERIRQNLIKEGMKQEADLVQNSTISTIHGFGLNIIEEFCYERGISPSPRQLTEAEQNHLIRKALTQVSSINTLLNDLKKYGYTGEYKGGKFIDGTTQLKNRVLEVINNLRSLGKGHEPLEAKSSIKLLELAKATLGSLYGQNLSKADTLNRALWNAILAVKSEYPDYLVLREEWGSSKETQSFVDSLYSASEQELKSNWKLWKQLQTLEKGRKIYGTKKNGPHLNAELAFSVWKAADKLSVHPGPLEDAIVHLEALMQSAIETLSQYQQLKTDSGLIDFGDMVHLSEQNLLNPKFLEEVKQNYDCLIIDEFQDTNPLQFSLLRQLQKAGVPTFIVGDLKQSIMGFQGSDSRLFSGLLKNGEEDARATVDELKNNWRSTPELMAFINAAGKKLFKDKYQTLKVDAQAVYFSDLPAVNQLCFDKESWSPKGGEGKNSIKQHYLYILANHVSELLSKKVQITDKKTKLKRPLKASDIAVLARTNPNCEQFSIQLERFGIKNKLTKNGFFESEAVQWTLCAIQYLTNFKNQFAVLNLLTSEYAHVDLKAALSEFIEHKHFLHPIVKKLNEESKKIQMMDFKNAVLSVIELLDIWNKIQSRDDAEQQRANLIKLIGLSDEFQNTQPESLEAMGIYGKNLNTFTVWLTERAKDSKSEFDSQPHTELNSDDAVVLSTWHASKGLEWPVVMILDPHHEEELRLPSIDMAYLSDDVDSMLGSSFVRLLMDFDDSTTQQKMFDAIDEDNTDTLKNLTYVAITRAREHLILPWFDNKKDNSMLSMLSPLFDSPSFEYQKKNMVLIDEVESVDLSLSSHKVLALQADKVPEYIPSVISPSAHEHQIENVEINTVSHQYAEEIDLSKLDELFTANEVGDAVHRLFEVHLMNKALLGRAFNCLPEDMQRHMDMTALESHLDNFSVWVTKQLKPISIKCELPILATNDQGQTISGLIDMLVETEDGYWIIDHKTDKKADLSKHLNQLKAYAKSLNLDKPVIGLSINWVRRSLIELVQI